MTVLCLHFKSRRKMKKAHIIIDVHWLNIYLEFSFKHISRKSTKEVGFYFLIVLRSSLWFFHRWYNHSSFRAIMFVCSSYGWYWENLALHIWLAPSIENFGIKNWLTLLKHSPQAYFPHRKVRILNDESINHLDSRQFLFPHCLSALKKCLLHLSLRL